MVYNFQNYSYWRTWLYTFVPNRTKWYEIVPNCTKRDETVPNRLLTTIYHYTFAWWKSVATTCYDLKKAVGNCCKSQYFCFNLLFCNLPIPENLTLHIWCKRVQIVWTCMKWYENVSNRIKTSETARKRIKI